MKTQDTLTALADNERAARELTQEQRAEKEPRQREDIVTAGWITDWLMTHTKEVARAIARMTIEHIIS